MKSRCCVVVALIVFALNSRECVAQSDQIDVATKLRQAFRNHENVGSDLLEITFVESDHAINARYGVLSVLLEYLEPNHAESSRRIAIHSITSLARVSNDPEFVPEIGRKLIPYLVDEDRIVFRATTTFYMLFAKEVFSSATRDKLRNEVKSLPNPTTRHLKLLGHIGDPEDVSYLGQFLIKENEELNADYGWTSHLSWSARLARARLGSKYDQEAVVRLARQTPYRRQVELFEDVAYTQSVPSIRYLADMLNSDVEFEQPTSDVVFLPTPASALRHLSKFVDGIPVEVGQYKYSENDIEIAREYMELYLESPENQK